MNKYLEYAKQLRNDPDVHYNCAQSVVLPFAEAKGYSKEQVYDMCRALNSGLRAGATCGAVAGALMVLGIYHKDDPKTVSQLYQKFREKHDNMTDCSDMLRANIQAGGEKKPHCDGLVYECIEIVSELVEE